jgi:diadenosine tetraphosphatase ApaH/serine/threonine PP2A family protein phosphatase
LRGAAYPMVYYIISDIHANLDALQVCLKDIEAQPPGKIICLGDIIGYAVEPNECIDRVREHCELIIMGNHDHSAVNEQSLDYFNQYAKEAMLWTRETLTPENQKFLEKLPFSASMDGMFFVHATPYNPQEWNYIFFLGDAELNFQAFKERLCFVGHSHQPVILEKDEKGKIFINRENRATLREDCRYIINVGSIGQPRDQDSRLCYAIYDSESGELELRRLEYPVEETQDKMRKVGLHPFLIERLSLGR